MAVTGYRREVMKRRDILSLLLGCSLAAMPTARPAMAQSKYPGRPIRLVIPFAAGGSNDLLARFWVDKMKALLGPVFVENQGGGGGLVGGAAVARADPDGYTILLGSTGSQVLIPAVAGHLPYDPAKDLEPISILATAALGVAIHPSLPVQNLEDLAAYAHAQSGKLAYGTAGAGTLAHLTGELFKSLTKATDIIHVPYKGNGQAISDLMSGHIPIVILSVNGQLLELHRAGRLRIVAVTMPERAAAAPEIPSVTESGLPGLVAQLFYGLFAPTGTPSAIVVQVSDATGAALAEDEFRQKLVAAGFEPFVDPSPEAARRFVEGEVARWTALIKTIGLKLE